MIRSLQITQDGSTTVRCHDIGESFHSDQGAVMESKHVFIENGLNHIKPSTTPLHIFEVGFGTGLNALLTYHENKGFNREIRFETIEPYPLESSLFSALNFDEALDEEDNNLLQKFHQSEWNKENKFGNFNFVKHQISLLDFIPSHSYNLVYFDAFSPERQPQLWSPEVFQMICDNMEEGGILVTYCAKGEVRRAMSSAGFIVERLKGAGRKREMLRAKKTAE